MGPLAKWLLSFGYSVSGSDLNRSVVTERLESMGVPIQYDHSPLLVKDAELIVYSSAIKPDNPERKYGEFKGIRQMRRAEVLGDLMRSYTSVCICGTHGKTTTTSLIGSLLKKADLDPTVIVGGILCENRSNAIIGNGNIIIAEADEFDRSFLCMYPTIAVITNIDNDHLDCYRNFEEIKKAFIAFTRRVPFFGEIVACTDDKGVCEILSSINGHITTYGIEGEADYRATDIELTDGFGKFDVIERGVSLGRIELSVPGIHNVYNALGAIAAVRLFHIQFPLIKDSLSSFRGVHRRFEVIARHKDITIVDDYAHHPREIQAAIDTAKKSGAKRVIAVFQPHLYSRTRDLLEDFASTLSAADIVYITDIYGAREEPIADVSASAIVERINTCGHKYACYEARKEDLLKTLPPVIKKGDFILFMGAGDINKIAYDVAKEMNAET